MKRMLMMILPLLLCLALPAQAAEAPKDYIFKALPNYETSKQTRNFNQLKIKSPKPESTNFIDTTYQGNLVTTEYNYRGPKQDVPSELQILLNYQNAVKKLGGEILYEKGNGLHASFQRNDKQYYMTVELSNWGTLIYVRILELAEMKDDLEIIDEDPIPQKQEKSSTAPQEKPGSDSAVTNTGKDTAGSAPSSSPIALKSKAEVEALLKDFSIKLTNTQPQERYFFTQIVCADGSYSEFKGEGNNAMKGELKEHNITFSDFATNKGYMLEVNEKQYAVESFDPAMKDALKKFDFMIGSHLFLHTSYMKDGAFKKTGSEKIIGRNATVYTMEFGNGSSGTFWIDDEYGFLLKYVQTGSNPTSSEVTEFTTSGVTVKGLLNLDGYTLVENK